jgi:Fe-S cluster biosynthesis and repair protein YggX
MESRTEDSGESMTEQRSVMCKKLGKELPGLSKPPFPGDIGEAIYNSISQEAWDMWNKDMQVKVINEYRLNMSRKEDYEALVNQMLAFLNLSDAQVAEVENEARGRSGS